MRGSYDDWYLDAERVAGGLGFGIPFRDIPKDDLKAAFERGVSAQELARSLEKVDVRPEVESDQGFQDWLDEVDSCLEPATKSVSTKRLRRPILYDSWAGRISAATFADQINPAKDFLKAHEFTRSSVPLSVWLAELARILRSAGVSVRSYSPQLLLEAYDANNSPEAFLKAGPTRTSAIREEEWLAQIGVTRHVPNKQGTSVGAVGAGSTAAAISDPLVSDQVPQGWGYRRCRCPKCNALVIYRIDPRAFMISGLWALLLSPLTGCLSCLILLKPFAPREVRCSKCGHNFNTPFG